MKRELSSAVKLSLILTTSIIAMTKDSKPRVYQLISDTSLLKNESLKENNSLDKNRTENDYPISHEKEETYRKDTEEHVNETLGYFAPKFKYPTSARMPIGNSTKLDCSAEGNPNPNITWYKNSRQSYNPQTFNNGWTLYLGNLTEIDVGNYTCVVCNGLGCIEHTVELIVEEQRNPFAPRPKYDNLLNEIINYGVLTFDCEAEGYPPPNITWHKNNNTNYTTWRYRIRPAFITHSMLILNDVAISDQGNYTCIVCNELGCIEETANLRIEEQVIINVANGVKKGYPNNIKVVKNGMATFLCPLATYYKRSYDYFLIRWFKLSKEDKWIIYKDTDSMRVEEESNVFRSNQIPILTIHNVTKDDEGWYLCDIRTGSWKTTSRAFLQVVEEQVQSTKHSWVIPTGVTVFATLLFMVVVIITICMKLQKEKRQNQLALEMAAEVVEILWKKKVMIQKTQLGDSSDVDRPLLKPIVTIKKLKVTRHKNYADDATMMSEYELPVDDDWEIPRETLVLGNVLGEGEFGKVVKAECVGTLEEGQSFVAVKMLKEEHTDADMKALVSEMEIMKLVGKHENIINLLGCCTQNGPLYVVIEFASQGCLREFLRKHRPGNESELATGDLEGKRQLTQKDLVSFSYQIAKGMEYLTSRQCLHRDLAARNVLVSGTWVLKIADFGLARDVQDSNYYKKKTAGKLPARWMAPESLCKMIFTVETDVWSFGVLMWEIMTLGATPYPTVTGQYLYEHLRTGHRLDKPPCCRLDVYMLMRECWSFWPRGRPSFTKLVENLDNILILTSNESPQCPIRSTNWT